jgi:hypothetical protein
VNGHAWRRKGKIRLGGRKPGLSLNFVMMRDIRKRHRRPLYDEGKVGILGNAWIMLPQDSIVSIEPFEN